MLYTYEQNIFTHLYILFKFLNLIYLNFLLILFLFFYSQICTLYIIYIYIFQSIYILLIVDI